MAKNKPKDAALQAAVKFLRHEGTSMEISKDDAAKECGAGSSQSLDHHIKKLRQDWSSDNLRALGQDEERRMVHQQKQLANAQKHTLKGRKRKPLYPVKQQSDPGRLPCCHGMGSQTGELVRGELVCNM